MMSNEEAWLVCLPVRDDWQPEVASVKEPCTQCGRAVWRASSSPREPKIVCTGCAAAMMQNEENEVVVMGPTEEQLKAIRERKSS